MAEIGLIDVDGHHFPNLALMRISAYHDRHQCQPQSAVDKEERRF